MGLCGEQRFGTQGIQNEGGGKDVVFAAEIDWLLARKPLKVVVLTIKSGGPLLLCLGAGCLFPLPVSKLCEISSCDRVSWIGELTRLKTNHLPPQVYLSKDQAPDLTTTQLFKRGCWPR